MNILILGVNGFIGSHLSETILKNTDWKITGFDLNNDNLTNQCQHPNFTFKQGDMCKEHAWIDDQLQKCDILLPLVAIATPATYVQDPLRIFQLDFEENLHIIRLAVKNQTRVIFPSTSEVYGMSPDTPFDEMSSNLTLGPIHKERWIYSCGKQMMDRVIYAMGKHEGLKYTLFRPFNWYGPRLDNPLTEKKGGARALTQFIGHILRGENIDLVNGGKQHRCFTYVDDGIAALMKIIENKDGCADQEIFNIGAPDEDYSIKTLAETLIELVKDYPEYQANAEKTQLVDIDADAYYGKGYDDVDKRVPSIKRAKEKLGWSPNVDLKTGIKKTLDYYL